MNMLPIDADFVRMMHDIDAAKGRTCGNCVHGDAGTYQDGNGCRQGYAPASAEDGCSDFKPWRLPEQGSAQYSHPGVRQRENTE